MRVLYVGSWSPRHHSDIYIAQAMERAGWSVERATWEALPVYRPLEKPDLLFMGKPKFPAGGAVRKLKAAFRKMQTALWYGDVRADVPPTLADVLPACDLVLPVHTGMFDALVAAGAARLAFWPLSAPEPYSINVPPRPEMAADVAFLGNRWTKHPGADERLAMLKAVNAKFDLAVYGNGWEGQGLARTPGPAILEDGAAAIRSAKLVLGIQHYGDVALSQSQRTWNVLACRGCLLNRYVPDLELLFADRADMVFWQTQEELLDLVEHYLSHEDQRHAIESTGYRYFMAHHTYDHRIKSLACYLDGRAEGTPWEWASFL